LSDGRYVYETKRPLQLCWLATIGTQEGRIAHHHTDATVPHIVALLGSVTGGKDTKIILNFQTFSKRIAFIHCSLRTRCVLLYKTLKSA
jgi:hypothetical protein